ncbi:MAG: RNA-processing protein [Candidatus Lokiarchaeota archaeon]|nr:RNA-processing protein [Candidatus Lokiarchaeota archaeon]
MLYHETIRIPQERVGVLVGRDGRVKRRIEKLTNTDLEIDSEGTVTITNPEKSENPVLAWKARNIVRAIARGFSPKRALSLIDDDAQLVIVSLKDAVGSSPSQIQRVAGRIIGERGRTRRVIEEITETKVSVYGKTVSIIGVPPGLDFARRAIDMLITGAPHSAVYTRLESMRREMNRMRAELWEEHPE